MARRRPSRRQDLGTPDAPPTASDACSLPAPCAASFRRPSSGPASGSRGRGLQQSTQTSGAPPARHPRPPASLLSRCASRTLFSGSRETGSFSDRPQLPYPRPPTSGTRSRPSRFFSRDTEKPPIRDSPPPSIHLRSVRPEGLSSPSPPPQPSYLASGDSPAPVGAGPPSFYRSLFALPAVPRAPPPPCRPRDCGSCRCSCRCCGY